MRAPGYDGHGRVIEAYTAVAPGAVVRGFVTLAETPNIGAAAESGEGEDLETGPGRHRLRRLAGRRAGDVVVGNPRPLGELSGGGCILPPSGHTDKER